MSKSKKALAIVSLSASNDDYCVHLVTNNDIETKINKIIYEWVCDQFGKVNFKRTSTLEHLSAGNYISERIDKLKFNVYKIANCKSWISSSKEKILVRQFFTTICYVEDIEVPQSTLALRDEICNEIKEIVKKK